MTLIDILVRIVIYAFSVYVIYMLFMMAFALYDVWKRDCKESRDESD
jgi:hypothetical protein